MGDLVLDGLVPGITGVMSALCSYDFAQYLGLDGHSGLDGHTSLPETLTTLYIFGISLAGFLSVTQAAYWIPPRKFIQLASPDADTRKTGLSELQKMFLALEVLDSTPSDSNVSGIDLAILAIDHTAVRGNPNTTIEMEFS